MPDRLRKGPADDKIANSSIGHHGAYEKRLLFTCNLCNCQYGRRSPRSPLSSNPVEVKTTINVIYTLGK